MGGLVVINYEKGLACQNCHSALKWAHPYIKIHSTESTHPVFILSVYFSRNTCTPAPSYGDLIMCEDADAGHEFQLVFTSSIWMGGKCELSDFNCGMVASADGLWVFQKLLCPGTSIHNSL